MRARTVVIIAVVILALTLTCGAVGLSSVGRANAKSHPTSTPTAIIVRPTPQPFGTSVPGSGGIIQYRVEVRPSKP